MKNKLIKEYNSLSKKGKILPPFYKYNINFVNGGFVEILGDSPGKFLVEFINQNTNEIIHKAEINNNMWTRTNIQYYVPFLVRITNLETSVVKEHKFNAKDKKVYIALESKAIGDTLAWFPYVEEFRKKHNCQVICSTFHNDWFESEYPEIEFIKPGTPATDLYAMYSIGWHYNEDSTININLNPKDFRKYGLQECSADILGIDYQEIKPKLSFRKTLQIAPIEGKYVVIAPHASAHAKYWNYPGGWQDVIDYLNKEGYKVVMITQEPLGDNWHDSKLGGTLTGVIDKTGDYPLEDRATDIMGAEFFIGVGSGLSWLSWALGTKTILISGFSAPFSEFKDCERVFTPSSSACNSCYNKTRLDAGDWEWCPEHKGTDRHFECTKTILPSQVTKAIKRVRNS